MATVKFFILSLFFIAPPRLFSQPSDSIYFYPTDSKANLSAEKYYEQGLSEFNNKNYLKAIDNFDDVLLKNPGHIEALYFKALSQEHILDNRGAITSLENAVAIDPHFTEAIFNLAILYFKVKNYEPAIDLFNKLLATPAGETQAIYFRGISVGENDIEPRFDQLLTMANKEADIYNYLGLCYSRTGDLEKSIENFDNSIELFDKNDNIYVNRGLVYSKAGNIEMARKDYLKALALNPYNRLAQFNLMILNKDDPGNSRAVLDEMIKNNVDIGSVYSYRAFINFKEEKYKESIQDYDSAILMDRDNPKLYLNRGMAYEKTGSFDAAMKDYMIAEVIAPEDPEVYFHKGNVFFKKENYTQSIEMYSKSIAIDPQYGMALFNRALAYYNLGNPENACLDARKALVSGVKEAEQFLQTKCNAEK